MKAVLFAVAAALVAAGCHTNKPPIDAGSSSVSPAPKELTQPKTIVAILAYVYSWHDLALPARGHPVEVRVRATHLKTDTEDHSRFAELWLPEAGVLVHLKKADHEVPERRLVIKDDRYRISTVETHVPAPAFSQEWSRFQLPPEQVYREMSLPGRSVFSSPTVEKGVRELLADWLQRGRQTARPAGPQRFYIAPMSEVSNHIWVFWENERAFLQLSADGGFDNPAVWDQHAVHLRATETLAGSGVTPESSRGIVPNRSITHVGRLLYNCIIRGQELTVD